MRKALFFTAYDRPNYLLRALETWGYVRGLKDWDIVARIEPGLYADQIYDIFEGFWAGSRHPNFQIITNPTRLGVLHHPWAGFTELFEQDYDFVVRAEDDLRVSDDILEYFTWAAAKFEHDDRVASIHGFMREGSGTPEEVEVQPRFDPLIWGTWRRTWESLIGPTWDHDYSTYNGAPGIQSGWDWNLNTRIYPGHGLGGVFPRLSRVDNIGVHGTHSTPDNFYTAPSFQASIEPSVYRELQRIL